MKRLAQFTGFVLITVGSLTILTLGLFLFYGSYSPQQSGIVAFASCLCWFLSYTIYQTIRFTAKQKKTTEPMAPHWTFTPRNVSMVMTVVTGLIFGTLVLLWFNLTWSFLIIAPFILYFPFSYMAYSAFQRPVRIKRLRSDFELLTAQWDEALYQQSTSFFNYALHITLAILATLLGLFILFIPLSDLMALPISDIGLSPGVLRAMGFGFLGGFLFSMYYVYRRYTTSDLLPPVYLYCAITIILGLVFNYVSFRALDGISNSNKPEGLVSGLVDLMSFSIGFFPILAVQWLTQTVYKAFGQPQRRSDLFPLDQLDGISQSQEIRMRDYGIDDAQNLASTEMPMLLINTPFPVQTVVDWVDQAVLMVLLNDLNALDNFRKAHVRTMTDFRDLWGANVEKIHDLIQQRDSIGGELSSDIITATKANIEAKLTELRDEQTEIANALNSNVSLLNALYSSTNFDMNIHYLNNYRKNIELLLPGWSSARFNRYLVEAYNVKTGVPNAERKELTRLWNFIHGYLEGNNQIKEAQKLNPNDDSLGMIVLPTSVEARMGLAWLYLQRASETTDQQEQDMYKNLADIEFKEAAKQVMITTLQLSGATNAVTDISGWDLVHEAASKAVQNNVKQAIKPLDQKPPASPNDGSQMQPTLKPSSWLLDGDTSQEKVPQPENVGDVPSQGKPEDDGTGQR